MKSNEIAYEVNNFTTNNHNLIYKCLCYSSTCNFTKHRKTKSNHHNNIMMHVDKSKKNNHTKKDFFNMKNNDRSFCEQ